MRCTRKTALDMIHLVCYHSSSHLRLPNQRRWPILASTLRGPPNVLERRKVITRTRFSSGDECNEQICRPHREACELLKSFGFSFSFSSFSFTVSFNFASPYPIHGGRGAQPKRQTLKCLGSSDERQDCGQRRMQQLSGAL